ncbi:DEAD/DEAH box helicase [Vibrio jasicida]|uniref:DEAD/DEAH box helicase n=1 Tax=Vibrio jasicida TaxID=766224 RepID=UPI0007AF8545|nr:AAA domain-containing protein [Vibrio jasicida]
MTSNTISHQDSLAFLRHLQDWMDYLCRLLDRYDDSQERIKYQRQLRWLLGFFEGTNLSLKHNLLINKLYLGETAIDNSAEITPLEPIQDCYQQRGHAFDLIEKAHSAETLFLIQGPPGTGKTTAICELVLQTLKANPQARILIASETHVAVDNALDRICAEVAPELVKRIYRHSAYAEGSQLQNPQAASTELLEKANDVWTKAYLAAPELTEALWQRFANDNGRPPNWLAKNLADEQQLVGVTCNQIEHLIDGLSKPYDLAIVDECSKATLPEWLMAVSVAAKAVLVGDHRQLPPTFCQAESDALAELTKQQETLIRDGVIDRLFEHAPPSMKGTLTTQYRMQPNIGQFISEAFYQGQLHHGRSQSVRPEHNFGWLSYPRQVLCPEPRLPPEQRVLHNPQEVAVIEQALAQLAKGSQQPRSVAVITPYRAQARALRKMVSQLDCGALAIEVDTVDAFQGRQADVVFFSFVRNNGSAQFYGDSRRINVALSRAKDHVYLVGDQSYLRQQRRYPVLQQLLKLPVLS